MAAPSRIAAWMVLVLALGACDVDGWLRARDVRAFREVGVGEAERLLAEAHGVLVEAVASRRERRIDAARPVLDGEGLPEELVAEHAPVVVLAADEASARRLAARLVRAGVEQVAVVRGGVTAWHQRGERRTAESTAVF